MDNSEEEAEEGEEGSGHPHAKLIPRFSEHPPPACNIVPPVQPEKGHPGSTGGIMGNLCVCSHVYVCEDQT